MSAVTPQEQVLGIVNNHWQSGCVGAAAQLELADLLAGGPLHVDVLAERTKMHRAEVHVAALDRDPVERAPTDKQLPDGFLAVFPRAVRTR